MSTDHKSSINFEALFLGPQSENREIFKQLLNFLVDEHIHWRRNFHPEDKPCITFQDQHEPDFVRTQQRLQETLLELSSKLKTSSMPWHSPRYLGHMCSDLLMPATLGYMATMLYNPNNVAWEGSPVTTELEMEVGLDLAEMMGFNREQAFGHITSGGTVANFEGLWVARNLKSVPIAIKQVRPDLVAGMSDWELMNLSPLNILDLVDNVTDEEVEEIKKYSVRGKGTAAFNLGKVFVPQSKHYSWNKGPDILGIGQENLVYVKVNDNFRMNTDDLNHKIQQTLAQKQPVLAVVGVVGSTEESAVDPIHEIIALRQKYEQKEGISFHVHVDAAYGGYSRSVFLDQNNQFLPRQALQKQLEEAQIIDRKYGWPSETLYRAYEAIKDTDSITLDPHKLGYVPYQAGAIVFNDKRYRKMISYFAPYVFSLDVQMAPTLLGSYIFEGSKAGAAAASVWAAHRAIGLHYLGYGKFIGESIEGALRFHHLLQSLSPIEVEGKPVKIASLTSPDINIVVYALNEDGNTSLKQMNAFNQQIRARFSYQTGPMHGYDFIVSSTSLTENDYGEAPLTFLEQLGIPAQQWVDVKEVFVMRSTVMSPYLTLDYTEVDYLEKFVERLKEIVKEILTSCH
jgi:tyrosine decarboxylase